VILPALIFVVVTVGVAAGYQLLSTLLLPAFSPARRRIAEEFRTGGTTGPRAPLFKNLDLLSVDQATGGMSDLGMAELPPPPTRNDWGLSVRCQELLEQANLPWRPMHLLFLMGALALVLAACGTWLAGLMLGVPAALLGAGGPLLFVHLKRRARREKFLAQVPIALDLMARVIRSGHSVSQALQAVAESLEQPIAGEFSDCQKQQSLGLSPELTFQELARRTGVVEMRIFVMAVLIQRQVGGNLSDVLERLAMLVRARLRLRNQVKSLTAEGRLQGVTLLALPFVMFGAMMVVNRGYAEELFQHVPLLIATGVSMLVGMLWIRKIVNFDV
jgi:tight adherence protein B